MPPLIPIIIGAALAASGVGGIILGGLTALTIGLTGLGASLIFGGLSRLLLPKLPSLSEFIQEARGRTITARQPVSAWRVIFGQIRIGGVITFLHVTGTTKEFLHMVITLSGHEVEEIGLMYFDGVLVPIDGSGDATGKFLDHVHVEKNLGTDTQAAFPGLLAAAPTKWTANHRQRGRAGVYVRLKFNPDKFPGNIPNITFDVKGKKIFDPRTSTTVWTENAALCFSDYLLDTDYGLGIPSSKLDNSAWIAAANLAEEQVALAAGGFEDRYTCNGSFLVSEQPSQIMLALLTAMGGTAVYSGGFWFIYGAAFRSPTLSFDEGDLRGPIRVQARTGRAQLFNAVKGIYVSAANNWQPSDFPPVTNATFESEDGGTRIFRDIELPYTISAATAQRLAKIELERSRRQKTVEVRFGPTALQAQPADVIQLSVARFGWTNKTFEVLNERLMLEQDEDGTPRPEIMLTLRETDVNVYGFSAEDAPPTAPGDPDLPDPTTVAAPTALMLSSFSITRTDGIRITFLKVEWTAPADELVTNGGKIEIEFKKNADPTWIAVAPVVGSAVEQIIPNVDDDVAYDVRIRSVNILGAKSVYVQQLNFTVIGIGSLVADDAADGAIAFLGTVEYRKGQDPSNNAVPTGLTSVLRQDGSVDVTLSWSTYIQGSVKAWALLIYLRPDGTLPTTADYFGMVGIDATAIRLVGLNPSTTYSFGIAAVRMLESGQVRTLISSPTSSPDWRGRTFGTPNFTGDIDGKGATPVRTDSDDGETAFVGTAEYRKSSAPSNNAVPNGFTSQLRDDGSVEIALSWAAYVQGTNKASRILIYVSSDGSAPTTSDYFATVGIDASAVILRGLNPSTTYSFGIAAARTFESGQARTTILSPTSSPDWRGRNFGAPVFTGAVTDAVDADGNLIFKNISQATPTTSSPSVPALYADLPEMSVTITTKGNKVIINFLGVFRRETSGLADLRLKILRDGVQQGMELIQEEHQSLKRFMYPLLLLDEGASAASHTWKIQWRSVAGAGTFISVFTSRQMQVVELG